MLQGHGGNISAVAHQFGVRPSDIIDMSSNINSLGPPEGLLDFLKDNLISLTALPEVDSRQTAIDFGDYMNIASERVLAGNGTTQFIYALPRVLQTRHALILGPTYSDYGDACALQGIKVRFHLAEDHMDFDHQPDRIEAQLQGVDTVFICNPNNPTGRHIPVNELQYLCKSHPRINFIVDESYLPFMIGAEKESMLNAELDNVIVLASLSKIFKIPGLRVVFMIAAPKTVVRLQPALLPWSVNSLAQSAVGFICRNKKQMKTFVQNSRLYFEDQRQQFFRNLEGLTSLKAYDSRAPFVLIQVPTTIPSSKIWTQLAQEKILIRDCSNFIGLTDQYIRISLKQPDINQMAVETLGKVILDAFNRLCHSQDKQVA
jgi:threonine-phosphate decarboxylase